MTQKTAKKNSDFSFVMKYWNFSMVRGHALSQKVKNVKNSAIISVHVLQDYLSVNFFLKFFYSLCRCQSVTPFEKFEEILGSFPLKKIAIHFLILVHS